MNWTHCVGLIAVLGCWNAMTRAAEPTHPIRVMSFNIRFGTANDGANHWDKRQEFLVSTIKDFNPDLLGTQETLAFQRDYLAKSLQGYVACGVGRDDGKDGGELAAIFYRADRFEKLEGGNFWLSETPERIGSKGWDAALPRIATWVKLKDRQAPDQKPILFLNTHFDHRGQNARAESAKLIRRKLLELGQGCQLIVTGDFNAGEGSDPYKSLFATIDNQDSPVRDSYRKYHPKRAANEGTFSGFKAGQTAGERIDWIGASHDWEVRLAAIDRTEKQGRTPSDHFPVTAVLRRSGQESTLRVLCYNIHHGEGTDGKLDLARLAHVIRQADPDLVALQEVDSKTMRSQGVDQTAELARLTGLYGVFGKAIDYSGGEYGQAILSRFPLQKPTVHQLPGEPEREQRIALECRVIIQDEELSFITTHLHHLQGNLRERQATKLNELFGQATRPIILAGDLNATPDSQPLKLLLEQWTNTAQQAVPTYPAKNPTKQIDFILFRPQSRFQTLGTQSLEQPVASDHRPILAVLSWAKR